MSQWVRLWEDMPTDPKWLVIRHRASQNGTCAQDVSVGDVALVFLHMMVNAAQHNGEIENWSDEDIAAAMLLKTEQVLSIREAMQGKVLEGNSLKGWKKRQPKREDSSTVRMRALRAKRDADNRTVTHGDAAVTPRDAPEEKRNRYRSNSLRSLVARPRATTRRQKKSKIEEKAKPTATQIAAANENGLSAAGLETEWTKFRNYNLTKGSELADWDAAWRMWIERIVTKSVVPSQANGASRAKKKPPPKMPGQDRLKTRNGLWVDGTFYPD